jgi:diguanylate cyclase (GGDEF)-like protein
MPTSLQDDPNAESPDRPQPAWSRKIRASLGRLVPKRLASQRLRLPLLVLAGIGTSHVLVGILIEHTHPLGQLLSPAQYLALGTAFSMVVCSGLLWLYGTLLSRRVAGIADVLEKTQRGDYSDRVAPGVDDEIGLLCRSVNSMVASAQSRERRIKESALVDPLTGLPNRTLLTERIRQTLALAERTRAPFSIAVLDLDRFKFINDTLGHSTGDVVLREVARRLKATVRESDTVARLGGDEFVLLLHGAETSAREVTGRIAEAMRTPLRHRDQLIDIGVSVGVSLYPQHGRDDLTLLRHADAAMYQAKRRRAGIQFFDGESATVSRSYLSMLGELRTALESNHLVLDYQPKLDLRSGLIVGVEGLVRWHHPTRGRVPPGEFIAFAEQTGFMREITLWVVNEGARFARELSDRDLKIRVAVNVSAQDIESSSFAKTIVDITKKHGIEPERLCLEITESGVVSETENALTNLRKLAEQGVRLSVDDFGTGYSTLKQLQQLPVHELKIDRSFVSGMNENRGSMTIVRSTIDLGKQLGLSVVAEGVETVAELRGLAAMGCDEVQGYYLAKPMLAADVVGWVEMRHALYRSSRQDYFKMLVSS